jgi:hypothetical protein
MSNATLSSLTSLNHWMRPIASSQRGVFFGVLMGMLSLFLSGCATSKNVSSLDAPMSEQVRLDLEKFCNKGNPFACYRLGSELDDQKNWGEAKVWFTKGCDLKLAAACSEASVLAKTHLNQQQSAIELAKRSCDLNDTLGCYNLACYQCFYQKKPDEAFASLELSVKLGYRNLESLNHDTDLECVQKHSRWKSFIQSIPKVDLESRQLAQITGPRHLYHPKLRFSYAAVPGFHVQYSATGVMVFDDAGSRIYFTGSNQAFSQVSAAVKNNEMISKGEVEIQTVEGQVNGYSSILRVVRGTTQGLEYVAAIYVTGDEKYTVSAQATYLASYHDTYGPQILQSAESVILDARAHPGVSELPYLQSSQIGRYRYAGLQAGGPIWTSSGSLARKSSETLVVNSFFFTADEPFEAKTFQKVWEMVAQQSAIEVPSVVAQSFVRRTAPNGTQAWYYRTRGTQLAAENKKTPVVLEVGLVKFKHSVPLGQLGFFWARAVDPQTQNLDQDVQALLRLELKDSVLEELKSAPTDEPDLMSPSTTGNGAIPAG